MKIIKLTPKTPDNDWIKKKNYEAKTILTIHIITIVSVFLVALIIQP